MAKVDLIFQGFLKDHFHSTSINDLFSIPDQSWYLASIAFVRKTGVMEIAENLSKVADKCDFFIGIRNGITSIQSITALLEIGIKPHVVDTANNSKIFHPKIYAAYNSDTAQVILGSANLTSSGLNKNIESSTVVNLNRRDDNDEKYISTLIGTFKTILTSHPEHVFQISNEEQAIELLKQGRLEDEQIPILPSKNTSQTTTNRDSLRAIQTFERHIRKSATRPKKEALEKASKPEVATGNQALVWESKPLTERSLNIPKKVGTHGTGDINLAQGSFTEIDFQRYFRDEVFHDLPWRKKKEGQGKDLERATISVEFHIKGVSHGTLDLEVTHDPRTNTKSYKQNNAMTKLKWGDARSFIAKPDLLDRTLKLYKLSTHQYSIVID